MPYHTGIRLLCVAQNPANGFPARLLDYRLNASTLSSQAIQMVRRLVSMQLTAVEKIRPGSGIGQREWDELMEVLGLRD